MKADSIYKQIGATIRTRRKVLGMKQEDLAKLLGISRGSLANVETGRQSILVHQLYRYAEILALKPFDLLPATIEQDNKDSASLPLPDGLKAGQIEQITRLLE